MDLFAKAIIRLTLFFALMCLAVLGLLGYPVLLQPIGFGVISLILGFAVFWFYYSIKSRLCFFAVFALITIVFLLVSADWILSWGI